MSEANKDQHEPSMEEILASIRRIISEDSEGGEAQPAAPGAKPATAAPPPGASPVAAPAARLDAAPPAAGPKRTLIADVEEEDEDVLLLTEEAEDEPIEESPAPSPAIDDSVLSLVPEEPTVRQPDPRPLSSRLDEPLPEPPPVNDDDRLLSDRAAAATLAAMSELVTRTHHREPNIESVTMGQANQTLEDITRELLRPILKSWLDENLPQIVERIVREEIGRLALDAQRR